MPISIEGKKVSVTGGARGIDGGFARYVAEEYLISIGKRSTSF